MKINPDIDELLNSFIDGELTTRQKTEVQRLITNDTEVRQRLRQLKKSKLLVGSLPFAEAPPDIFEQVTTSLERRNLLAEQPSSYEEYAGARHLFVRKVLAAAAMIGLFAVLGIIVYSIIAPETAPESFVAVRDPDNGKEPTPAIAFAGFNGRLELKTNAFIEIDSSISKAIKKNPLLDYRSLERSSNTSRYNLTCSPRGLGMLLADLNNIWQRFDSATLFVETEEFGQRIVIDEVTTRQIAEVASRETVEDSLQAAKDFAFLNNMNERLQAKDVFAALDTATTHFTIPMPVLLKDENAADRPAPDENQGTVSLVIVVTAGK